MRQHGQKLVFAAVGFTQLFFGLLARRGITEHTDMSHQSTADVAVTDA